jgi:8-oxo-dGTP pyrophosphatase MutT (NUDIX family)
MTVYEQSAGFIIFREDKKGKRLYLLLHYPGGHVDFPKGHIEKGETKYQAAARELREETGITKVDWVEGFKEKLHYFYKHDDKIMSKEVFFFLAQTKQKNITISFEHQGSFWLPYEEAYQKITYENSKELLKKGEETVNFKEDNHQKKNHQSTTK